MNYGLVDTHVEGGIGGGVGASQDGATKVTVYIQVDDLAAYLKKAERLGAKTLVPPTEIPNMVTFALFADPEGNAVGLVKE
jgi:predicted enzyme related to lactoylglutathione lyase